MRKFFWLLGLAVTLSLPAAVVITVQESGSDVVVAADGTVNTTGLTLSLSNIAGPTWNSYPQSGAFRAGGTGSMDYFTGFTTGGSFGSGSPATASTRTGDSVYLSAGYIGLPASYLSGTTLSGSDVFANSTFASLGMTPGSYVWSWGSDSITLNISAIPEPGTYAMLAGVAGLGFAVWRRRRATADAARELGRDS